MFLLDNLLLAPFNSLLWVFKEVNQVVQQETSGEAEGVTRMLSELYMRLDTGSITEEQFEIEEKQLLDRLDAIELRRGGDDEQSEDAIDAESEDAMDEAADAASGEGETDTDTDMDTDMDMDTDADRAPARDASEPPDAKRNK